MKYLLINGSSHKGNTWKLVELIKNSLQNCSSEATFDEIHLADLHLPFCCGCSLCFRKGHTLCPHNGIMQKVINDIDHSDGVIFATTTFNMRETALMKNFLDHLCFMIHRPHFFHSKAIVITTTGGVGAKYAAKGVASTLKAIGFNRCYLLASASFSWNDYKPNEKARKKCDALAIRFHKDVSSGKMHSPSLGLLIPYNLFRGMSLAYVKGTEYETEDGVYWTDPQRVRKVYDCSVPVPYYKKAFGSLFYCLGKMAGKFVTVTYRK